jgi:ribosomal protein L13E
MIDFLRRWFARAEVRLAPRTTMGREVGFTGGYSLLELERAGLTEAQARAAGLPIDRERESSLGANVMQLDRLRRVRGWARATPPPAAPTGGRLP